MSTAVAKAETLPQTIASEADQLGAEITELCSYIYAAESRLLSLIREFDDKQYWAEQGLCSCAHWLNFKCGIGMNAAREKVRVAHALATLPKISAAFERGALSYSKVRAMTRIADQTNEDYLLMVAEHGTAHHVEKLVSRVRTAEIEDGPYVTAETSRRIRCEKDANGEVVFRDRQLRRLDPSNVLPDIAPEGNIRGWFDREFAESGVDSETCTPRWYAGERIDWQVAVSALL